MPDHRISARPRLFIVLILFSAFPSRLQFRYINRLIFVSKLLAFSSPRSIFIPKRHLHSILKLIVLVEQLPTSIVFYFASVYPDHIFRKTKHIPGQNEEKTILFVPDAFSLNLFREKTFNHATFDEAIVNMGTNYRWIEKKRYFWLINFRMNTEKARSGKIQSERIPDDRMIISSE